jgi:GTP-binding protein
MPFEFQDAEFIRSAVKKEDFPKDMLPQVVFSGKSNVGKSSVINQVLGRKNYARVGGTPGKTIHINYFLIEKKLYFVDLPGYGYAKVSKSERDRWGQLIESWFADPSRLTLGILIVDARHKPTGDDCIMADWYINSGKPFVVVANKLDKLKKSELAANMEQIRTTLKLDDAIEIIPFSAEKGTGRQRLIDVIHYRQEGKG